MDIISINKLLLSYSFLPGSFKKTESYSSSSNSSSNWTESTDTSSYVLNYNLSFYLKNTVSGETLVQSSHLLRVCCKIDDIQKDVRHIYNLKVELNQLVKEFLKQNVPSQIFSYFDFKHSLLAIDIDGELEDENIRFFVANELRSMKYAMGILPFDELSAVEKEIAKIENGFAYRNL